MHELAALDGDIAGAGDISIRALSAAALYGKGVFTTLAIRSGQPFLWEKHWRRIISNAGSSEIDVSAIDENTVRHILARLLELNGVVDGRARITLIDMSSSRMWPHYSDGQTRVLIMTGDPHPQPSSLRLCFSPYLVNSTSPLAGIKSCNYLDNLMAAEQARARGFDEAVRINERYEVTSACMANIFWVTNEKLLTPALETGCLPGTTREFVMENLKCAERAAPVEELLAADTVFLTSAGLGVASVSEIDGTRFQISDHPISKLIPRTSDQDGFGK